MKKVVIVATIVGFIASFEMQDIAILQSLGYEVHCATNLKRINDLEKKQRLLDTGIICHQIDFERSPFSFKNFKAAKQLKELFYEVKFDLVHCHTPVGGVIARKIAKEMSISHIIYSAHGFHFYKGAPLMNWLLFYNIEKKYAKKTDALITINTDDYKIAIEKLHPKRTYMIHGVGIDLKRFKTISKTKEGIRFEKGLPIDKRIFISVGELSSDKNHILMLKALKAISDDNFFYIICGKGALEKKLTSFIKINSLENNVKLLGYRDDIPDLLAASDYFVFPSHMEGLSVALMEAIAAKKPIICSKSRGNIDLIKQKQCLFNSWSVKELVACIRFATTNCMDDFVDENYQNLQKYDLKNVRLEMMKIYKETTGE